MNPNKASRISRYPKIKWINSQPWGTPLSRSRRRKSNSRKVKKGVLTNFVPVEVVNAITGEIAKGYMRGFSARKLRKWLEFHNQKDQVEQVSLPKNSTLFHLCNNRAGVVGGFPILIKLGKYQVPYVIEQVKFYTTDKGKQILTFDLRTVDNLKYLETIADRKAEVMKLFNKVKRKKK